MSQLTFEGDGHTSSRYLKRFEGLTREHWYEFPGEVTEVQEYQPFLQLMGDTILVEKLGKIESKTAGGIIMPTADLQTYKQTMQDSAIEFGVVLMTGPGDVDSDGQHMRMNVRVGDIIALPMNVQWYSQFGHMKDYAPFTIGRMRDSQVMMRFSDYTKAMEVLNGEEKSEVQGVCDQAPVGDGSDDL